MFVSSFTTIYFFVKNFFLECLYSSEYDIWMFLLAFWLGNRSSIKYLRNWRNGGGVIQNEYRCVQGKRGIKPHVYVSNYTISQMKS